MCTPSFAQPVPLPTVAPLAAAELEPLRQLVLLSPEDEHTLGQLWDAVGPHSDDLLDVLLGLLAAQPTLRQQLTSTAPLIGSETIVNLRYEFRIWFQILCQRPTLPLWLVIWRTLAGDPPPNATAYAIPLISPLTEAMRLVLAENVPNCTERVRLLRVWNRVLILQATLLHRQLHSVVE
ncbi:MAG: protoglobin domain-containing protein [Candidatus Competibacteraceae bacterium]